MNNLPRILHFVDTETTDLESDTVEPEVISYAIVRYDALAHKREIIAERYFSPRGLCAPGAAAVNGYSPERWTAFNGNQLPDFFGVGAAKALQEELHGAVMVGSNIDFDKRRLQFECRRAGMLTPAWHHRSINLTSYAGLLWAAGVVDGSGLSSVLEYFGFDPKARHTALGDCVLGIDVFERFQLEFINKPKAWREALAAIKADPPTHSTGHLHDMASAALEVGT